MQPEGAADHPSVKPHLVRARARAGARARVRARVGVRARAARVGARVGVRARTARARVEAIHLPSLPRPASSPSCS